MLSSSIQARLYDICMSRAAAEMDPVSRIDSSSLALPGPIRAPDSKTMLILTRGISLSVQRAAAGTFDDRVRAGKLTGAPRSQKAPARWSRRPAAEQASRVGI